MSRTQCIADWLAGVSSFSLGLHTEARNRRPIDSGPRPFAMDHFELQQLDALLHNLCDEKGIIDGLLLLEQRQIAGAPETIALSLASI